MISYRRATSSRNQRATSSESAGFRGDPGFLAVQALRSDFRNPIGADPKCGAAVTEQLRLRHRIAHLKGVALLRHIASAFDLAPVLAGTWRCDRIAGIPFRKLASSASFGRHVLSFSFSLRELRNVNRAIAAIRIVRSGDTPTAARVGSFTWRQSRIVIP